MDQTLEIIKPWKIWCINHRSFPFPSCTFPSRTFSSRTFPSCTFSHHPSPSRTFLHLPFPHHPAPSSLFSFSCLAFFLSFPCLAFPLPCFAPLMSWLRTICFRITSVTDSRWKMHINTFSSLHNPLRLAFRVGQPNKVYPWTILWLFLQCIIVNTNGLLLCFSVAR